jgi:hypothetical protein
MRFYGREAGRDRLSKGLGRWTLVVAMFAMLVGTASAALAAEPRAAGDVSVASRDVGIQCFRLSPRSRCVRSLTVCRGLPSPRAKERCIASVRRLDRTRPRVAWRAPTHGLEVRGILSERSCRASASDRWGIRRVAFFVNGRRIGKKYHGPFECRWNTRSVRNGLYTITAKAVDQAGRVARTSRKIRVKNPPPTPPS